LVVSCALVLNCSTSRGFNRGVMRSDLDEQKPSITDKDIEEALARKPQLARPFRLGVYFRPPARTNHWMPEWHWGEGDRARFDALGHELVASGLVSEFVNVSPLAVPSDHDTLKAVRLAAAQHGLDAVMVVAASGDLDRYNNNWAATYAAIVPVFFVPGTVVDAIFLSRAAIWDVRNEFLYVSAESEATGHSESPAVFTDERGLIDAAKTASLEKLTGEIRVQLAALGQRKQ
jgi:hypothetical protein